MSLFQQNIHFLRKSKMLTQKDAADLFDTNADTWSKWEKSRDPKYDKLIELADYFGVSIDDLLRVDLAKDGIPNTQRSLGDEPTEEMAKLYKIMAEKDITIHDMKERLRMSKEMAEEGKSENDAAKILRAAKMLEESVPEEVWKRFSDEVYGAADEGEG